MKSKKFYIVLTAMAVITLFLIFSNKNDDLIKALKRTTKIHSFSTNNEVNVKLDFSEMEGKGPVDYPSYFRTGLTMNGGFVEDDDFTKGKLIFGLDLMGIKTDFTFYSRENHSKETTKLETYMEIPPILKTTMSEEFLKYKYLYLGQDAMNNLYESEGRNIHTQKEYKDIEQKLLMVLNSFGESILKYKKSDGNGIVEYKGKAKVEINEETKKLKTYSIALSNEELKEILKAYSVQPGRIEDIKEIYTFFAKDLGYEPIDFDISHIKNNIDSTINNIPNIIGEEGINIDFAINKGYLVQNKFYAPIAIDNGLKIYLDGELSLFDINDKSIKVEIPENIQEESINFFQYINAYVEE